MFTIFGSETNLDISNMFTIFASETNLDIPNKFTTFALLSVLSILLMLFSRLKSQASHPKWLASLRGKSPLLSHSEFQFVSDVCTRIKRGTVAGHKDVSPVVVTKMKRDLQQIVANFEQVVDQLKTRSSDRLHFLRVYPEWKMFRQRTICQMKKIADSVDEDKENCEVAKIIGNSISFLGGGLCLMSGRNEQNISRIIGSVLMGIGNLTTAGTSAAGRFLLHKNIEEAKKLIGKDRNYLKSLWSWMEDSTDLLNAMDSLRSIGGSLQGSAKSLHQVMTKGNKFCKQNEMNKILKSFNCPPELRDEMSDVMGMLVSNLMLFDRFRPLFNFALTSSKTMSRLRLAAEIFQSAAGLNTAVAVSRGPGLTPAQRRSVVEGMCLDVAGIALTAIEMNAESVESRKIKQVVDMLRDESDTLKNLYEGMKELDNYSK